MLKYIDNSDTEQDKDNFSNWLAGFVDGEGCFSLSIEPKKGSYQYRPKFSIAVRYDDIYILEQIRKLLKWSGNICRSDRDDCTSNPIAIYSVRDPDELSNIIIPFFEKYTLRAKKSKDFQIWKKAVDILCTVKQRPVIYKHLNGKRISHTRWKQKECDDFAYLSNLLKQNRMYVEPKIDEIVSLDHNIINRRDFGNWFQT